MKSQTPLVSICCIAYNQENYIGDALDGFLLQKTNFPIEILVHDDASTDGTAEVIRSYQRKYTDLIYPVFQTENQYSKGERITSKFLLPNCRGKYIAFCEGDDYWTDPDKLQKQVDILETDPSIGLVHTNYCVRNEKTGKTKPSTNNSINIPEYLSFKDLLFQNLISTLTVVVRRDDLFKAVQVLKGNMNQWKMGDYPLWLEISRHKKIKYLNDVTGVYRVLRNSLSSRSTLENRLAFRTSTHDIKRFFIARYSVDQQVEHKIEEDYLSAIIEEAFVYKNYQIARRNYLHLKENYQTNLKDCLHVFGSRNAVTRIIASVFLKIIALFKIKN